MGIFSEVFSLGKKVVKSAKKFVDDAKTGRKLQAGFTLKAGDQTDASKALQSGIKSIPVYVWGIAVAFVLLLLGFFVSRKK